MTQNTERMVWLDALRLTAGLSMVCLHATADPSGQPFTDYTAAERIGPMMVRTVVYVARTELFMVIAVFLLLLGLDRRPRTYVQTITEQMRRLLIPFAAWTVFYLFFNGLKAEAFGYPTDLSRIETDPLLVADILLLGGIKYHMHFLPTLFGLMLAYPLFRIAAERPWLGLGVIGCLLARQAIDSFLWSHLDGHPTLPFLLRLVKIVTYAGYGLAAGSCLWIWRNMDPASLRRIFPIVLYAGLVLFAIKLTATALTITEGRWPFDYAPGYWADFLMPLGLFLGCMCLSRKEWPQALSRLAPYSFGIYLVHPVFLDLCEIGLQGTQLSPMTQVGLKIAVAIPAAFAATVAIAKLRLTAWTIGLGPLPFSGMRIGSARVEGKS